LSGDRAPKPALAQLFEDVAAVMGLHDGRLELVFEHGHLRRWFSHSEQQAPGELGAFDERAAHLVDRRR
jgi:hypothetical protein